MDALKKLNKKQSILGLIPMLNVLESAGVNPEKVLRKHGISLDNMSGAALIDLNVELDIVRDALAISNEPLLGLKAGRQVTFTSYGTFAMLAMSAPNFLETLKVSAQFQSLSLLISHMTLHIEPDWVELRYILPDVPQELRNFIADRDLMGTYIFMREFMTDPGFYLLGAGTARPKPTGAQWREYREHIDIDMQFDQAYMQRNQPVDSNEMSILELAKQNGIGVFTSVPLMQGKLLEWIKNKPEFTHESSAVNALQFIRSTPGVLAPLVGQKSDLHVKENLEVLEIPPFSETEFNTLLKKLTQ